MLGNEDCGPGLFRHGYQFPAHLEIGCQRLKFMLETVHIELRKRPFDAHEEQTGFVILVLVGMHDICAVPVKEARDPGDQAFAVRTVYEQDCRVTHN
jgi:hypothetical protein